MNGLFAERPPYRVGKSRNSTHARQHRLTLGYRHSLSYDRRSLSC